MPSDRPTYSLRFTRPHLRELIREVAARDGISQNELLETAAEHEVIARGALIVDDLDRSARRLAAMTRRSHADLVTLTIDAAAEGEGLPDPLPARQIARPHHGGPSTGAADSVLEVFRRGRDGAAERGRLMGKRGAAEAAAPVPAPAQP